MDDVRACNCIGPQNGDPLCPCMMRDVRVRDGRWVREQDFGPVRPPSPAPATLGCICPPGAELTCQGALCPRRGPAGATS
jgi:hypothetical protein